MTILFSNQKGGTISVQALIGDTTMQSAAFANLPVVLAPDFLWLTMDQFSFSGAPEIVKVTNHTAASTTVTVVRGQQGSSARLHPLDSTWAAVITADDMAPLATPTWQSWTPVINSTGTNGVEYTLSGRYLKTGKIVHFTLDYNRTSGTLSGGDTWVRFTGWPFSFAGAQTILNARVDFNSIVAFSSSVAFNSGASEVVVVNPAELVIPNSNNSRLPLTNIALGDITTVTVARIVLSGFYEIA